MSPIHASLWNWCGVLLACAITGVAAYSVPVTPSGKNAEVHSEALIEPSEELIEIRVGEDLGTFLAIQRWGTGEQEIQEGATPIELPLPPSPALNPVLLEMHYVGWISVQDQPVVLLDLPGVGVARFAPGDRLPDGRILVSVTDESLTLKAEGMPEETLMLFPSVSRQAEPASSMEERR